MTQHDLATHGPNDKAHADSERAETGSIPAPAKVQSASGYKQEFAPMLEAHAPHERVDISIEAPSTRRKFVRVEL